MAKTKGPLLSLDAHGSLAKELTYSSRRSGSQVRKYNKPLVTPSAAQRGQRRLTEFLVAQWQNMSDADKATWETNAKASGLNLTGYHYFLREAQRDLYTHHGLCGYWSFNKIVSGKVLDISGNGNDGTLGPSYPSNVPTLITSKSKRFDNALTFDGIDEYVNCGHKSSIEIIENSNNEWSIEWWQNILDNTIANETFFINNTWFFYIGTSWDWYSATFQRLQGDPWTHASFRGFLLPGTIPENIWNCFLLTHKPGDKMTLYFNSKLVEAKSAITWSSAGKDFLIGRGYNSFLHGSMDEVCVYKRIISAAEAKTRYNTARDDCG